MAHVEDTQGGIDPGDHCVATVQNQTTGVQDLCCSSSEVEVASNNHLWLEACETLPGLFSTCCACEFLLFGDMG